MKYSLLSSLASIILLAACAEQMKSMSEISLTPADDARKACRSAHPMVKGNFIALAKCLDIVDDKQKTDNPDADLITRMEIARTSLARDVDAGQITVADYQTQMQQVETQMTTEAHARSVERAHNSWGISHGLDPANRDVSPVPVIPPG